MSTPTSRVLRLLLEAKGPRSGQEMGDLLGCSRAAIGKAVAVLREQGFVIGARSRSGYSLLSEPAGLSTARVEARLPRGCLGNPLIYLKEIDSTNLETRRRAEAGAVHGTCVTAEYQTAGRGRLDRAWSAPKGSSLMFSLLLRPRLTIDKVFVLNNVISLAVCRAVELHCGVHPMVKWPNDVFLGGRKLVGVLTEFTSREEMLDHVVVGAGINVNWSAEDLAKLEKPAASIMAATGKFWDRAPLLAAILVQAHILYADLEAGKFESLRDEYQQRSLLMGRRVEVDDSGSKLSGTVAGFESDGALVLSTGQGRSRVIRHGDVSLSSVEGLEGRS